MVMKIISEFFVRPSQEVNPAKNPVHLGPIDLMHFLNTGPIQKGLLFPHSNTTRPDTQPVFEQLKLSLSIALNHFYLLAGRFETIDYDEDHTCSVYLDSTKGPGARLIHATVDLTASDILSSVDVHPAVRSFFDLGAITANFDGLTRPLLTIQVTELLGGVFIGFTMNHGVVDGTSFIHFITVLSEIFRDSTTKISRVPTYNNVQIPSHIIKLPVSSRELGTCVTRRDPGELRVRIFHFSSESIATLKVKANEECRLDENENENLIISSYMALSSLVWRSITRAHSPEDGDETSCLVPLNARTRLDPSLSDDHFGNLLGGAIALCKSDELLGRDLGWAARYLTQVVKKVNHDVICGTKNYLANVLATDPLKLGSTKMNEKGTRVSLSGSPRFDMYGPEFGLGRAAAIFLGSLPLKNGKVTSNPGREGKGSVDLEIMLKPHIMSALESDEDFMSYVTRAVARS